MLLRPIRPRLGSLIHLALALAIVLPMGIARAQDDDGGDEKPAHKHKKGLADEMSGQGYGVAGCGLGSLIFGAKPGMIQIVSATFNYTSYNQTFAITTGTLNCDIPQMGFQAAVFIEGNREVVMTELARGKGETVAEIATILKCKDFDLFGAKMRENFGTISEDGISSIETTRRMLQTIDKNPDLKMTCQTIIAG